MFFVAQCKMQIKVDYMCTRCFLADNIEKGNTLQTAASQPPGGITLYKDILANVLAANVTNDSETSKPCFSRKPGESIFDYASRVSEDVDRSVCEGALSAILPGRTMLGSHSMLLGANRRGETTITWRHIR